MDEMTINRDLESWIEIATRKLSLVTAERLRCEFEAHYEEAYRACLENSNPEEESHQQAMKSLGNARKVNWHLKGIHITVNELIGLVQFINKPYLSWAFYGILLFTFLVTLYYPRHDFLLEAMIIIMDIFVILICIIRFFSVRYYENRCKLTKLYLQILTLQLISFAPVMLMFTLLFQVNPIGRIYGIVGIAGFYILNIWNIRRVYHIVNKLKQKDNEHLLLPLKFGY